MKMKLYSLLLILFAITSLIYLNSISVNQIDPEINISNNVLHSNYALNGKETKCSACKGKGIIKCTACEGYGEITESSDCEKCRGTGKIYKNHNITTCIECYGGKKTKKVICSICNGSGWVKCRECDGKGIFYQ